MLVDRSDSGSRRLLPLALLPLLFLLNCGRQQTQPTPSNGNTTGSAGDKGPADTSVATVDPATINPATEPGPAETPKGAAVGPSAATLLTSIPVHEAKGVDASEPLVLTFSEAMNSDSVEAAISISTIEKDRLTFDWNSANTTVTIHVLGNLEMASGDDAKTVVAMEYTLALADSATSAAGIRLAKPDLITFSTLRMIETTIPAVPELSGSVRSDGTDYPQLWAGDSAVSNTTYIAVMSFLIDDIPDEARVESARVQSKLQVNKGNPSADLNSVYGIYAATFAERKWSSVADDLLNDAKIAWSAADGSELDKGVNEWLAEVLPKKTTRLQLAFAFDTLTDGDNSADNVQFTSPQLHITYAVP